MNPAKIKNIDLPINELVPHPKHDFIYCDIKEDDYLPELEKQIVERGLKTPLIVNENGLIISGYRRYKVLKNLDTKKIKCKVQSYKNESDELWDLVINNLNRCRKTRTQKVREGIILFDILKSEGRDILINELTNNDRITDKKINLTNETRFIVAQIIGIEGGTKSNGKVFSMAKSALEKADEYKRNGNVEIYNIIISQLNKISSNAAYSLAYRVDVEKLSDVAKRSLLSGQVKGNSSILPLKSEFIKQKNSTKQNDKNIDPCRVINDTNTKEKLEEIVREYNAKSRGEIEIVIPEKEKGYISKTLEKAMTNFRNEIAQCMTHRKDINKLDEEERKRLNKIMTKFIEDFEKDKNIITGGM